MPSTVIVATEPFRQTLRKEPLEMPSLGTKPGIAFAVGTSEVSSMRVTLSLGVVIAAASCFVAGCAPIRVSSHVDRDLDFTRYRTFDWGPADALPAGDPRLERDGFYQDHVQGAIERNLATRGFERAAPSATPDVRVHFHAVIDRRINANQLDPQSGYCSPNDCQPGVSEYQEGTLVVDMIDVRTNRLVWRGWAQNSVEGVLDNQDRLARKVEDGVRLMFMRLPAAR
jgi:hypothetical protein